MSASAARAAATRGRAPRRRQAAAARRRPHGRARAHRRPSGHAVRGRHVPRAAGAGARVPGRAAARLLPHQAVPPERVRGHGRGVRQHAEARLAAGAGAGPRAAGAALPAHRAQPRLGAQRGGGGAAARQVRRLLRARQAAHRHPRARARAHRRPRAARRARPRPGRGGPVGEARAARGVGGREGSGAGQATHPQEVMNVVPARLRTSTAICIVVSIYVNNIIMYRVSRFILSMNRRRFSLFRRSIDAPTRYPSNVIVVC